MLQERGALPLHVEWLESRRTAHSHSLEAVVTGTSRTTEGASNRFGKRGAPRLRSFKG